MRILERLKQKHTRALRHRANAEKQYQEALRALEARRAFLQNNDRVYLELLSSYKVKRALRTAAGGAVWDAFNDLQKAEGF